MNKQFLRAATAIVTAAALFTSCAKDDPAPDQDSDTKYVLITLADRVSGNKAGFISSFDEMPTGTISNATAGSLEGQGMGGWRTYGNNIYKMFRTADYVQGIEKINVAADGTVTSGAFISSKDQAAAAKYFGTGNFVIQDDNLGYYWDAAEPYNIQKFNPTTMVNTGSMDFEEEVKEMELSEVSFAAIGQKFLAIKNGKLFANLTYAKNTESQIGFFDDFYTDVYIAVIDLASGTWEKRIKIEDTGSIAYINENHMYDFDDNGDLYIVTQGTHAKGLGGKSKIARIKANETDIDKTWEMNFSEFRSVDNGKFVNVFAKNGRLIVTLNTETLAGGPTGNINSADIWEFYSVDIDNPTQYNKIEGIPVGTNPGAAMLASEVDGKVFLRGSSINSGNGYYVYDFATNSAELAFSVDVGGAVSGFHKIEVQ
ncbi:hypothetical protein [Parapedobacter sp. 10938]|uniref:hypothetical protein n=1 Tax=Parapedobacter flavus TaxID=3110225 RepID=UPI002DBF7811|nr:hypothetical protein [Parapedobacter sp. 10938]MEC3880534.1 hypothetical protein [Parapedobacter sp. 10938]